MREKARRPRIVSVRLCPFGISRRTGKRARILGLQGDEARLHRSWRRAAAGCVWRDSRSSQPREGSSLEPGRCPTFPRDRSTDRASMSRALLLPSRLRPGPWTPGFGVWSSSSPKCRPSLGSSWTRRRRARASEWNAPPIRALPNPPAPPGSTERRLPLRGIPWIPPAGAYVLGGICKSFATRLPQPRT